MKVEQVATLSNTAIQAATGQANVMNLDLSNTVDAGRTVFGAGDNVVDNYVKEIYNQIGKMVFDDRVYRGAVPSVLRDAWTYGSITEKIRIDIPDAEDNPAWGLVNGQTYNQDKFYQPKAYIKLWNDRTTFMIPMSITEMQVRESFQSAYQLNAFFDMIYNAIDKGMTLRLDELVRLTINNMIAITLVDSEGGAVTDAGTLSGTSPRVINLLAEYNAIATPITQADILYTPEFLRYAAFRIKQTLNRMRDITVLYNVDGAKKFTPAELQHVVLLNDFKTAAEVYLYDAQGQFLVENLKVDGETVNFWQGAGSDYGFSNVSKIDVVESLSGTACELSGILGVAFDRDALGVANLDRHTRVHRNEVGEFENHFVKATAGYWNDPAEQFVVFVAHA